MESPPPAVFHDKAKRTQKGDLLSLDDLFLSVEDISCIILSIHFLKLYPPENGWISMDQSVRVKPNKNSMDNTQPKITKFLLG